VNVPRLAIAVALISACGTPASPGPPPSRPAPTSSAPATSSEDAGWGKFHSKRFQLTVPLPDGRGWKIDDHRQPELVAVHPGTASRIAVQITQEEELMNHDRCGTRARELGWLPRTTDHAKAETLTTVEEEVQTGPDAYDSRIWVAIDPGASEGSLEGHVFLFGAFLRRCLLVHYTTRVASPKEESVLASRLAVASSRIVKGIAIDPLRTTDSAQVPRDRR
jgi:hypothetical protein